jgi:hypothetical protein
MAAVEKVLAPLVVVRDAEQYDHYLYRGADVPDFVSGDVLSQLRGSGMVGSDDAGEPSAQPAAAAAEPSDSDGGPRRGRRQ